MNKITNIITLVKCITHIAVLYARCCFIQIGKPHGVGRGDGGGE